MALLFSKKFITRVIQCIVKTALQGYTAICRNSLS